MAPAPFTGMAFVSVHVRDLERARAFYGGTLGLKQLAHDPGWGSAMYQVGNSPVPLGVHQAEAGFCGGRPGRDPGTPSGLGIQVPDVARAVEDLRARGVAITEGAFEGNGKRWAAFTDPDGNEFMLTSP